MCRRERFHSFDSTYHMVKFKDNATSKRWIRQFKHDPYMALVLGTRLWVAHNTLKHSAPPAHSADQPWPVRLRPYAFPDHPTQPSPSNRRKGRPCHRTYYATLQFWTKLTRPLPLAHLIEVLTESIKQQNNQITHKIGNTVVNGSDVLSMLEDVSFLEAL